MAREKQIGQVKSRSSILDGKISNQPLTPVTCSSFFIPIEDHLGRYSTLTSSHVHASLYRNLDHQFKDQTTRITLSGICEFEGNGFSTGSGGRGVA